jgi:hypothetical protein
MFDMPRTPIAAEKPRGSDLYRKSKLLIDCNECNEDSTDGQAFTLYDKLLACKPEETESPDIYPPGIYYVGPVTARKDRDKGKSKDATKGCVVGSGLVSLQNILLNQCADMLWRVPVMNHSLSLRLRHARRSQAQLLECCARAFLPMVAPLSQARHSNATLKSSPTYVTNTYYATYADIAPLYRLYTKKQRLRINVPYLS